MKIRELLEDVSTGGTGAGSMAPVEAPLLGAVISRTMPATKTPKRKYANTVNTAKYTKADAEDK
jgi:hypothetical protein